MTESQPSIFDILIRIATRVIGASAASVFILREGTETVLFSSFRNTGDYLSDMEIGAAYGEVSDKIRNMIISADKGIVGYVIRAGKPLRVDDVEFDTRFERKVDEATGFKTKSVLCVPIRDSREKIVGAIELLNKQDGGHFTDSDLKILSDFSSEIGKFYHYEK